MKTTTLRTKAITVSNEVKEEKGSSSSHKNNSANVVSIKLMKFWSGEMFECDFRSSSQTLSSKEQTRFQLLERCDPAADLVIRLRLTSGEHVNVKMNVGTLLLVDTKIQVPAISEIDGKKASISLDIVSSSKKRRNGGGRRRSLLVILSGLAMWFLFGLGFVTIRNWKTKPLPPLTLLLVVSAGLFLLGRSKRDRSRDVNFEASLVVHNEVVKKQKEVVKKQKEITKEESSPSLPEEKKEMSFADAKTAVKSLKKKPDTSSLLRLYGLYKVVTEGPCKGDRPSVWDPRNRAKYDAWNKESSKSKQDCESEYIALVKSLLSN